jgi:hypothetical protein
MARDMGVIGGLPLSAADVDGGFPPVPARQCLLTKKIGVFLASFYTQKAIKSRSLFPFGYTPIFFAVCRPKGGRGKI